MEKGNQAFHYGDLEKVIESKPGMDDGSNNVDYKIVFQSNGQKVVSHAYNVKQRFTITGQGYKTFVEKYLDPLLRKKIESLVPEANKFNMNVLANLGKTVKIGNVRFKTSSNHSCNRCSQVAQSISKLHEHM